MASATPSPTPTPDAMKYTVDVTFPEMSTFDAADAAEAAGDRFAADVLRADGVASVFATANFVTVTRRPGCDWAAITAAVQAAAAEHL